jgi:hypothetical protein
MVRTGARAEALGTALAAAGFRVAALYRELGGQQEQPALRPGAWDLALAGGVVVELDESSTATATARGRSRRRGRLTFLGAARTWRSAPAMRRTAYGPARGASAGRMSRASGCSARRRRPRTWTRPAERLGGSSARCTTPSKTLPRPCPAGRGWFRLAVQTRSAAPPRVA